MGSIVWLVLAGNGISLASPWTPTGFVSVGAGHEDDRPLVDDPSGTVIPGGLFWEARARGFLTRYEGPHHLRLGGFGSWSRYVDVDGRRLVSGALIADARWRLGGRWDLSLNGVGGVFDDAYRPSLRRWYGAGGATVGYGGSRVRLEAGAGPQRTLYPAYVVLGDDGVWQDLVEISLEWRTGLLLNLGRGTFARVDARLRDVETESSFFDVESRTLGATLWLPAGPLGRLIVSLTEQRRDFAARDTLDADRWRHLGLTLERRIGDAWTVALDASVGDFRGVGGGSDETARFGLRLGRSFGTTVPRPEADDLIGAPPVAGEPVLFRHLAPGAARVSLVGDFNGWNPEADPLHPVGGDRWEVAKPLPAGVWQYAYRVDGRNEPPTDALYHVDDGFGGRNGVITVLENPVTSDEPKRLSGQRDRSEEPKTGRRNDQERERS